jgi:hypothetical protein
MPATTAPRSRSLLSLAAAARLVPAVDGRPCSSATVRRWITHGVRDVHGRYYLTATAIGSRYCLTRADLRRFLTVAAGKSISLTDEGPAEDA